MRFEHFIIILKNIFVFLFICFSMKTTIDKTNQIFKNIASLPQPGEIISHSDKKEQEDKKFTNPIEKLIQNIQYEKIQKKNEKNKKIEEQKDDSEDEQLKKIRNKRDRTRDKRRKRAKKSSKKVNPLPKKETQQCKADLQVTNEQNSLTKSIQIIGSTNSKIFYPPNILPQKHHKQTINNQVKEENITLTQINEPKNQLQQTNINRNEIKQHIQTRYKQSQPTLQRQSIFNRQNKQHRQNKQFRQFRQFRQPRQTKQYKQLRQARDNYRDIRKNNSSQSYYKTRICPQFVNGNCQKGQACSFAHGEAQLRINTEGYYKTRLCIKYTKGLCPKVKQACHYAHGLEDIRVNDSKFRQKQPRDTNPPHEQLSSHNNHMFYKKNTEKDNLNSQNDKNKKIKTQNQIKVPQKYQNLINKEQKKSKTNSQNRIQKKNLNIFESNQSSQSNMQEKRNKYQQDRNKRPQHRNLQFNNPYFINNNPLYAQNKFNQNPNTQIPQQLPQPNSYQQYPNYPYPYSMNNWNSNGNGLWTAPFNQGQYNPQQLNGHFHSGNVHIVNMNNKSSGVGGNADNLADDILNSSQNANPISYYNSKNNPPYPYNHQLNHQFNPNFPPFQQYYYPPIYPFYMANPSTLHSNHDNLINKGFSVDNPTNYLPSNLSTSTVSFPYNNSNNGYNSHIITNTPNYLSYNHNPNMINPSNVITSANAPPSNRSVISEQQNISYDQPSPTYSAQNNHHSNVKYMTNTNKFSYK